MLPSFESTKMDNEVSSSEETVTLRNTKKERNFPSLDLSETSTLTTNSNQPVLVIQSPKTPTLSRKLKAVSLDSDPPKTDSTLEASRDVFSMPNTPKRQIKQKLGLEYSSTFDDGNQRSTLTPNFSSNLKRFASNTSISGSQTLKTLPEIMMLQDFSDNRPEPVRIKAKGLLERRGSNASLTIDLGSNSNISETKPVGPLRLSTVKSVSHLNLSTVEADKCSCMLKVCDTQSTSKISTNLPNDNVKTHLETCIYNETHCKMNRCKSRCYTFHKKCNCLCNFKCRRKSLSNENLYVPPCSFCQSRLSRDCTVGSLTCKGCRKAVYPRQPGIESPQMLSEDFKLHLQNIQYLQTAGSVLSVADLKLSCETHRVPKLHQEFWEVPLNLQEKCIVSGSQCKNRYKGVLPNEQTRVTLPESQNYIHANYIKGPDYTETAYIATQGPMTHTCEDFWEMVWTSKSFCIVMLTGLVEKGRNKCELYFPLGRSNKNVQEKSYLYVTTMKIQDKFTFGSRNTQKYEEETFAFEEYDEVNYGNFKIRFIKKETLGECVIRELELSKNNVKNKILRKLYHYWYPNWHDHKMANPLQVLQLALHVLDLTEKTKPKIKTEDKLLDNNSIKSNSRSVIGTINKPNSFMLTGNLAKNIEEDVENVLQASENVTNSLRKPNDILKWDVTCRKTQQELTQIMESQDAHNNIANTQSMLGNDKNLVAEVSSTIQDDPNSTQKQSHVNTNAKQPAQNLETVAKVQKTYDTYQSSRSRAEQQKSSRNSHKLKSEPLASMPESNKQKFAKSMEAKKALDAKSYSEMSVSPIIVHCSAGIGRTGCFLAILNGIKQLKTNYNVDVLATLCSLRLNRGGMVQTAEQYELIHRVLNLYTETM